MAYAWVNGGRDYLVGLDADNGKVRWRYRCPTSAPSSAEFHNSDDSESPKGEYQGVSKFVKLECGSKTVRVRVSNGRVI